MSLILSGIAGAILLLFSLIALVAGLRWFGNDELTNRLQLYVTDEASSSRRGLNSPIPHRRELTGSFMNRTILPAFKWFSSLLGRLTPVGSIEALRHQLLIAGNPLNLGPREFYGIRVAFIVFGGLLAYAVVSQGFTLLNLLASAMIVILCYLFPLYWLRSIARTRQNNIRKGLPDALDMLSVCADAGLGFDQSLQRVSEYWKTPIGVEFGRVVAEMEMGVSRREALRNMAARLDVTEVSSFISIILQSELLGMSIADTLHAQADQMRIERRFRAQELARTIPIKMLVPLAFLIFPAILAVILGPAIPQILSLFQSF